MGPLDVAVVIDLDPLRRAGQLERLGQTLEQLGLRGRLGHLAREALAGIARGGLDELGLLPALRHRQRHLAPALLAQRLGHQVGALEPVRQQQRARRLVGVVELADERLERLGRLHIRPHARIEVAIAPVLARADEKHLHAGLPLVEMQGDHIGLGHRARVDALRGLHLRQRLDPVAQSCGALEFHRLRGLCHLRRELFLDLGRAPREIPLGVAHLRGIVGLGDLADAGGRAALDLVLQAGARAALEHGVGAVAQLEHPLQLPQRPVDRTRRRERAVIAALVAPRAAMLADHRIVVGRHEDVGKALVVAQSTL